MGHNGEPVPCHTKPRVGNPPKPASLLASDEFDARQACRCQWQWHANHQDDWYSLAARKGWLRLFSRATQESDLRKQPGLLLQKFPARSFIVETEMETAHVMQGEESGLVVMGAEYATLAVRQIGPERRVFMRLADRDIILQQHSQPRVRLRLKVSDGGLCQFGFDNAAGNPVWVADVFQARAGTWIGAKVGLYGVRPAGVAGGHADFDYFRFAPSK